MSKKIVDILSGQNNQSVTEELLNKQLAAKEAAEAEIQNLYNEIETLWDDIVELRKEIKDNSLLELMVIIRNIMFPAIKPQVPSFQDNPILVIPPTEDGILEKLGTTLSLGFLSLFAPKKYNISKKEYDRRKKIKAKKHKRKWTNQIKQIGEYSDKLDEFKGKSLNDLMKKKDELEGLRDRLEDLISVIKNGYSTLGPELISGETTEVATVQTIPFVGLFDITEKQGIHIKVGAATEDELRVKEGDIPQLKIIISSPMEGGTVSVSFEYVGTTPLTFTTKKGIPFASTAIGHSASIKIVNDLIPGDDSEFEDVFPNSRTIEIPYSFATDLHVAQNIASELLIFSNGSLIVKPTHVLQALVNAKNIENSNAAQKLTQVLDFTKQNVNLYTSWAEGGGLVNADLLQDMAFGDEDDFKKLRVMLRTGTIKYPWQYFVCGIAVAEGREDLLQDLVEGTIGPTQLYLKLEASNAPIDYIGGRSVISQLTDGVGDDSDEAEIELSPMGSRIMGVIDPETNYYPAQRVRFRKAIQIILDPDFQRGLLDPEAIKKRREAITRIGRLVTSVRVAKLDLLTEELQLELDSLEKALIDFKEEAKDLRPEIAAGLVEVMAARARKLAISIPEISDFKLNDDTEE